MNFSFFKKTTQRVTFIIFISLTVEAKDANWSSDYGCKIKPNQLNSIATHLVKQYRADELSLPNRLPFSSSAEVSLGSSTTSQQYTYEVILRPLENAYYFLPLFPLIGVHLTHKNHAVYICGYSDGNPKHEHLTFYFMYGHGLDPGDILSIPDQLFFQKGLFIQGLELSISGVNQIPSLLDATLGRIPLLNILTSLPTAVFKGLEGLIGTTLNLFTGVGVERITITPQGIEFANGIDLNHPTQARLKKFIAFPQGK